MQPSIKEIREFTAPLASLADIPSPPKALYVRGQLADQSPVAIVGSRKPTAYGRRTAQVLAARLAGSGVGIVSGLAFGIDTIVHRAALDADGTTLAVLPGGLKDSVISPRANLRLAAEIVKRGALLSEYPPQTAVRKEQYLARNRLISGMARAVVLVEAALPSGSLITARHAIDQGRDVWAVPGQIDSQASAGTNWLISQGAFPLTSIDEFLESLGVQARTASPDPLLSHLAQQPVHADELAARLQVGSSDLDRQLTRLELSGLVRHLGGRYYVRV